MARVQWDQTGEKHYETGTDHGVLYPVSDEGEYANGVPWNGLTGVTETPSGAESNKQYADNMVYLNLVSAEEFGATVTAFTYPDEFAQCDGTAEINGVEIGQQERRNFGLAYRTLKGNDTQGTRFGYKLHLVYGCLAAPSERPYTTVNDSPEAVEFSWDLDTTPVPVGTINGVEYKPTSILTIDSTKHSAAEMQALEDALYGTEGQDPRLPLPAEVVAMFAGALTEVETVDPSYDDTTDMITIPSVTGVVYTVNGEEVPAGTYGPISEDTVVRAKAASGYKLSNNSDEDWTIRFA
jgi:hypothetical protein